MPHLCLSSLRPAGNDCHLFYKICEKVLFADVQRKLKNSEFPWMLTPRCLIGEKTWLYHGRRPDLIAAKLWPDRKAKPSPVIVPLLSDPH